MKDSLGQRLVERGEFQKAADWLGSLKAVSQGDRILKARIELEIGEPSTALQEAEVLLREHLDKPSRAYCLDVAGRALARLGATTEGLSSMQKAIAIAAEADSFLHAELLSHYTKALLNWVGLEPALAELSRLRKVALETANRRAIVDYHISCARVAALRGWWAHAAAETATASDLLNSEQCLDQLWQLKQVEASIAASACDAPSAYLHATAALSFAKASGSKSFVAATLANLASILTIRGEYQTARAYVQQALSSLALMNHFRFSVYATQIDIGLSSADHEYAFDAVRQGEEMSKKLARAPVYYQLWFELHRVKWLIAEGRMREAAALALTMLGPIETLADAQLLLRMRLLGAEALAESESTGAALDIVSIEAFRMVLPNVDIIAETNRLAAILCSKGNVTNRHKYLSRASCILVASGLVGQVSDVERTRSVLGVPELDAIQPAPTDPTSVLEGVALALQLGKQPAALAAEILSLVSSLGIADSVRLVQRDQQEHSEELSKSLEPSSEELAAKEPLVFPLGSYQGSVYTIEARPRLSADTMMPWLAIDQIIRCAVAMSSVSVNQQELLTPPPGTQSITQHGMVVAADQMRELLDTTRKLAPSSITVLITGETGTGKELLARALHEASPRKDKPFIPFNCTAVARDMLDAQLFGYRRGSFTGAQESFQGVIRAAAGGTLFLDEIGEIGLDVQPKLLRFLESGEIHPLGEPKPIAVNVRVVAATNANLEQLVEADRFREDLFYRLNVVRLQVPPLRERREEIPPLVQHFLEKCVRESRKTGLRFAEETMEYLVLHKWPGNVRQLANEVRRLVALAEPGAVLMPEHLSADIRASRRTIPAAERTPDETEFVVRLDQPMPAAMEHVERTMVQYALKHAGGRLEDAAQMLGLSRKGLYLKRQRLGLLEPTADEALDPAKSSA
jgi:DNA-binding NtrC family response regulator/tetratricopeptide (TPR) repeat protein